MAEKIYLYHVEVKEVGPFESMDEVLAGGWEREEIPVINARYLIPHDGILSFSYSYPLPGPRPDLEVLRHQCRCGELFEIVVEAGSVQSEGKVHYSCRRCGKENRFFNVFRQGQPHKGARFYRGEGED
ncbi:hypothetical protein [Nitrolancea hollandica]|uniref:Uncharacterized protein n=1 Tax=Nitrolancea hollandica Lb TaxID=1129897 RepID=I4EFL3_9BACT|nr:hypothetical protein [Nitrolancea hollandica]CCF83475.1 hypothetical protein NITHO_2310018 [Nitrolancea hollandica Lb]